ncbi:unnamed protein product [Spirodela intermedia]|uniref:Phytocyanin domain-containing protein n=1 Tax=Spirodela intermedia TaxID=51605 RepID=A0A7I8IMR9_SPIIN|nr:unnamed protein product [Spirodela intermedia]CAA6659158.1 unnamed protein product [Spirodela intermedia]
MSFFFFLFLAVAFLGLAAPSAATVHKVGDAAGWTIMGNVDYAAWAASRTFRVGDTIVFTYNSNFHNVLEVNKVGFGKCSAAAPIATYTTGNDSIVLKSSGHQYFLCGIPGTAMRLSSPAPSGSPSAAPAAPIGSPSSAPPAVAKPGGAAAPAPQRSGGAARAPSVAT